jgi:hypothetical protein
MGKEEHPTIRAVRAFEQPAQINVDSGRWRRTGLRRLPAAVKAASSSAGFSAKVLAAEGNLPALAGGSACGGRFVARRRPANGSHYGPCRSIRFGPARPFCLHSRRIVQTAARKFRWGRRQFRRTRRRCRRILPSRWAWPQRQRDSRLGQCRGGRKRGTWRSEAGGPNGG